MQKLIVELRETCVIIRSKDSHTCISEPKEEIVSVVENAIYSSEEEALPAATRVVVKTNSSTYTIACLS